MLAGVTFQPSDAFQQVRVPQPSHAQPRSFDLGVIAPPQAPFPADFVTLPVSAGTRAASAHFLSQQRKGKHNQIIVLCIPNMLKQRTSFQRKYAGWAYCR